MKKLIVVIFLLFFNFLQGFSFCGFYVAKAGVNLFNETSQVILVRNNEQTTLTMSNDFNGDVTDFAMVVPVPTVLKKNDIKVVDREIFDRFDAYSAPRLVEYNDPEPCGIKIANEDVKPRSAAKETKTAAPVDKQYNVTIEAKYTVGEYDIIILSATESTGLSNWLIDNGYKIPDGANEVLAPYIKSNLKFFVVKVNLPAQKSGKFSYLRPLQIQYNSPKFMLPIRLGMANANGNQDLVVYALSSKGRVECTNYRTDNVPTGNKIPEFIKDTFGKFYADVFEKVWEKAAQSVVFLEYAWDISQNNFVKCDPCVSEPPNYNDIKTAGVNFDKTNSLNEKLFFTRLHVRYNRQKFPQDLFFQETNNKQNFQARYVINHPANNFTDCIEGKKYLETLIQHRKQELQELVSLTSWQIDGYSDYVSDYENILKKINTNTNNNNLFSNTNTENTPPNSNSDILLALCLGFLFIISILLAILLGMKLKK